MAGGYSTEELFKSRCQSNVSDADAAVIISKLLGLMSLGTSLSFSENQLNFTLDFHIGTLVIEARSFIHLLIQIVCFYSL